jgi:hypothetical protein
MTDLIISAGSARNQPQLFMKLLHEKIGRNNQPVFLGGEYQRRTRAAVCQISLMSKHTDWLR